MSLPGFGDPCWAGLSALVYKEGEDTLANWFERFLPLAEAIRTRACPQGGRIPECEKELYKFFKQCFKGHEYIELLRSEKRVFSVDKR